MCVRLPRKRSELLTTNTLEEAISAGFFNPTPGPSPRLRGGETPDCRLGFLSRLMRARAP